MFPIDTETFLNQLQGRGWHLSLEPVVRLLGEWGNPERAFKCVHLAGTNGKGSTAAFLESIFRQAGYRTGLYTSPHLLDARERIRVHGQPIPWGRFDAYVQEIQEPVTRLGCTYFETLTAVAFRYFADAQVDLAIIETGLGGRFDATNVVTPELSLITSIDLDHVQHLGQSRAQIAREKAGIIKPNRTCLSGVRSRKVNALLHEVAVKRGARFHELEELCRFTVRRMHETGSEVEFRCAGVICEATVGLPGRHQVRNAALAVAASHCLERSGYRVSQEAVVGGLAKVVWPGRLQLVGTRPRIVLDVAHNPAAMRQLIAALRALYPEQRFVFVVGFLADKDCRAMARQIAAAADSIVTVTPVSERALPARELAEVFQEFKATVEVREHMEQALAFLQSLHPAYLGCVTGSHVTVGNFLRAWKKVLTN